MYMYSLTFCVQYNVPGMVVTLGTPGKLGNFLSQLYYADLSSVATMRMLYQQTLTTIVNPRPWAQFQSLESVLSTAMLTISGGDAKPVRITLCEGLGEEPILGVWKMCRMAHHLPEDGEIMSTLRLGLVAWQWLMGDQGTGVCVCVCSSWRRHSNYTLTFIQCHRCCSGLNPHVFTCTVCW